MQYFFKIKLLAIFLFVAASAQAEDCNRACLKTFVDGYFTALLKNDPSNLPTANNVKFTENGQRLKLGQGFWQTAGDTTYRMEIYDTDTSNAAAQAAIYENTDDGKQLAMFLVRLKVEQQKITEVETIVARKDISSGFVWNPESLSDVSRNFSLSIRPAEQNSRFELMAAANGYWRAFETNGTENYHPAPFLPSANRIENGLQTTNNKIDAFGDEWGPYTAAEQFDRGLFQGRRIYDRRYPVIDTEKGVVLSIVRFGQAEGADVEQIPDQHAPLVAEFFAVQSGMITEIQVVMTTMPASNPTGWPIPAGW